MFGLSAVPAAAYLGAFLLLDAALFTYTGTAGAQINAHFDLARSDVLSGLIDLFLIWKISRGASWAWGILLVLTAFPFGILLAGAGLGSAYAIGLCLFAAAQIGILLTPAVRSRVFRRGQQQD
jgi:hypothetical protein